MLPRAKSFWVSPSSRNWRMKTLPSLASMTRSTAVGVGALDAGQHGTVVGLAPVEELRAHELDADLLEGGVVGGGGAPAEVVVLGEDRHRLGGRRHVLRELVGEHHVVRIDAERPVVDALADQLADLRIAARLDDHRHLQLLDDGQGAQASAAVRLADDHVDLVDVGELAHRAHRLAGGAGVVAEVELDLVTHDAALGVVLVGEHLGRPLHAFAGDGGGAGHGGGESDLDRRRVPGRRRAPTATGSTKVRAATRATTRRHIGVIDLSLLGAQPRICSSWLDRVSERTPVGVISTASSTCTPPQPCS